MQGCIQDFFWGGGGGGGGAGRGGRGDLTDDLHMYMCRCHAYILVNKSHNNAVITNLCMSSYHLCYIYYMYIIMDSGGGGGDPSAPPPLYATLIWCLWCKLQLAGNL